MNATTQDTILAQWQQWLQATGQQVSQLLQESHAGCLGLLASHPTDPTPMGNALSAVGQRIDAIRRSIADTYEGNVVGQLSLTPQHERATEHALRHREAIDTWIDESWDRFDAQWRYEAVKAMWPHAQQAMQRPTPCSRCAAPLARATPHQSETVTCRHCGAVNQAVPDAVVGMFYASAPDAFARLHTLEHAFAVRRHRQQAEVGRREHHARTGEWPDEPIESLKRWEVLEREQWTAYVRARAQVKGATPQADQEFIDSRMKGFYDEMSRNEVWRKAHGMPPLHPRAAASAAPDWGPLKPDQVEELFFQEAVIQDARPDASKLVQVLARFGYRDLAHFEQVRKTFLDYHESSCGEAWFQALVNKAVVRAQQDRVSGAVQANAHLMSPVEGVSLELYAKLSAHQGSASPDEFLRLLAQHALDRAKFDRIAAVFIDRMSKDTSGAMASVFSQAWANAGAGKYAAAAKAGMDAMGPGGIATSAPSGAEPIPFERYAEISGAMSAWSKQGKDISAMLMNAFQVTAQDFSQISMYWSARMTADMSLMDKMSAWTQHFEQVYLGQKTPGAPLPKPGPDGRYVTDSLTRDLTPAENQIYQALSARDYYRADSMLRDLLAREPTNAVALALRSLALGNLRISGLAGPQLDAVVREQLAHAPAVLANLERRRIDAAVPIGQIQMAALVEAHAIIARDKLVRARSVSELSDASDLAEEGLEIHGQHADLLKTRCLALFKMQDYDEAKEVLARIMLLPPDPGFMSEIAPYVAQAPGDPDGDEDDDDDDD